MRNARATLLILPLVVTWSVCAAEDNSQSIQQVAKNARDSVVVVTTKGREGKDFGMGTGFAIRPDLIVTNLHVIGEARPISIKTRDGNRVDVVEVFASDATFDLAILRIDQKNKLPVLQLGDDSLEVGQPVVGIGHPLALKDSVVSGRVAGDERLRAIDLWQLEMIIEPGISGGPLLNMDGRVNGIISMKSMQKDAFGFAIKVEQLKRVLESPNPISMEQWETIGRIDPSRWEAKMGGNWRERRGIVKVDAPGDGFGGRSLLLRTDEAPEVPFEIAVSVKLRKESGAAGLVFHSDEDDKHYGFYPSNGGIRLTSFEGPSVFNWNIIRDIRTKHYQAGDWNELKVRVEEKKIIGFVNGQEVMRVTDVRLPPGSIGLCKFRDTSAEYKNFRFGKSVSNLSLSPEKQIEIEKQIDGLSDRSNLLDIDLLGQSTEVMQRLEILEQKAKSLEQQAADLRGVGKDIHFASVCNELAELVSVPKDENIDLLRATLLIAKLDNAELDIDAYIERVDGMVAAVRKQLSKDASAEQQLSMLDDFLFKQNGFHGSRTAYYTAANSYLDRVIDDREGLPITLSVLYISMAKRLDLKVVGVGLPGHFVVRHEPGGPDNSENHQLIDVFDRGERMSRNQANAAIVKATGRAPRDAAFASASNRSILVRILTNLSTLVPQAEMDKGLPYIEALVALQPEISRWRALRGVLRHQTGRTKAGIDDFDWLLEKKPDDIDLNQVQSMRDAFANREKQ